MELNKSKIEISDNNSFIIYYVLLLFIFCFYSFYFYFHNFSPKLVFFFHFSVLRCRSQFSFTSSFRYLTINKMRIKIVPPAATTTTAILAFHDGGLLVLCQLTDPRGKVPVGRIACTLPAMFVCTILIMCIQMWQVSNVMLLMDPRPSLVRQPNSRMTAYAILCISIR